jgi:3-hydroxyisobutyrate dehydrogenase-like beta-hydroxyacid dehydrogenase
MSNSESSQRDDVPASLATSAGEPRAESQPLRPPIMGEIGFIGLGRMGTAMAKNLAAARRPVIAYVRRKGQIAELKSLGIRPTTDIGDLFDCQLVISMLPDDDAVRQVVLGSKDHPFDGLATGLMPGAIHLSMSTISTACASQLAAEHARLGQSYVAAPVFGNPDAAKARQLFIVAGGGGDFPCPVLRPVRRGKVPADI